MNRKLTRKLSLVYEPLDDLLNSFHPENPKAHDLAALSASFDRFGFTEAVMRNNSDGRVIAGHGRLEGLLLRRERHGQAPDGILVADDGTWLVPVLHGVELSEEEADAYLIAANRIVELGGWDLPRLERLLNKVVASGQGLDGVGFTLGDLDALLADLGKRAERPIDPDSLPQMLPTAASRVQVGQTWRLGQHRIRCGDAIHSEDLGRLLGKATADIALTDPPYNVDYGRHGGAQRGRRRSILNDALSPDDWAAFVRGWSEQLLRHVSGAVYVFMSSREWPIVSAILVESGAQWSDTIIWAKDQFTLGRADYQRQYEPIWYGWKKGTKHHWNGDRSQGDVWPCAKPLVSDLHPTMKPVALLERAINNSCPRGGTILDLFAGSGSTIIAAERLGRQCYAMDLEPRYVQIAIERWEQYTGRSAELEKED
jgi:DNA modification methylase